MTQRKICRPASRRHRTGSRSSRRCRLLLPRARRCCAAARGRAPPRAAGKVGLRAGGGARGGGEGEDEGRTGGRLSSWKHLRHTGVNIRKKKHWTVDISASVISMRIKSHRSNTLIRLLLLSLSLCILYFVLCDYRSNTLIGRLLGSR